jgi:hypothetical protein
MPSINNATGSMQHDEAASAPRMPPAATSPDDRSASETLLESGRSPTGIGPLGSNLPKPSPDDRMT